MAILYNSQTKQYEDSNNAANTFATHEQAAAELKNPTPSSTELQSAPEDRSQVLKDLSIKWAGGTPAPTVGDALLGDTNVVDETTPAPEDYSLRDEPTQAESDAAALARYQSQIDAQNEVYDRQVRQARVEGEGRQGQQRAMSARGGLLGSDFGAASKNRIDRFNAGIVGDIEAERNLATAQIMSDVRNTAEADFKEKREARKAGVDAYLAYNENIGERQRARFGSVIADLVAQGHNISSLTPEQIKELQDNLGVRDVDDIAAAFATAQREYDAAASEAQGKADQQEFENTLETEKGELAREKFEQTQTEFDEKTRQFGITEGRLSAKEARTTKEKGQITSGGLVLSRSEVGEGEQKLQESRGSDGYANPNTYAQMLNMWVQEAGRVEDFVDTYPPDLYLNQEDPQVDEFIKTQMKSQASEDLLTELTRRESARTAQEESGG